MQVPVLNKQGQSVGSLTIDEADLGGVVNPALLKQAYVRYHANKRQGSARTKSRGMIEGSTRKLYKQKGTGNARAGAIRTNIRRGGGRAFAKVKTREDYRLDMPVKMRRLANRNALLAKLIDNEVKIIDSLTLDAPKTKSFEAVLEACGVNRSCVVAVRKDNANVRLSARNIEGVTLCPAGELNCFEMLRHRYLIIEKADLERWLEASKGTAKGGKNRAGAAKETA
jgi:large subunit ribosomal protein L4